MSSKLTGLKFLRSAQKAVRSFVFILTGWIGLAACLILFSCEKPGCRVHYIECETGYHVTSLGCDIDYIVNDTTICYIKIWVTYD